MAIQYKPGKMGKITAPLNDKNEIGIDGKPYPIAPARLSGIQGADPKIGDDCEYKIAYQGPDNGAIIFFAIHRDSAPTTETAIPASKPIDEGLQHTFNDPPEKPSPRTIVGVYVDKSSTQVTVKEGDGVNHVYPCDISLLQYLAKKDIPVKKGETFSWELIQSGEKWVAMKVGPAPEEYPGFKSGKDILKENLEAVKSTTVPPAPATVPKVPVTEETLEKFNERMAKKETERKAQEKVAAKVKAKEDAEGDKRMAENAAYAVELAKQASVPAEPTGIAKIVADTKALKQEPEVSIPAGKISVYGNAAGSSYDPDKLSLIKAKIAPNCTDTEIELLLYMAKSYGLDPLLKQIWAVKRSDSAPALIFAGRDGFLAIAHRSGHFDGMQSGVVYENVVDGKGAVTGKKIVSAWCEVWRNDMTHSFKSEVPFSEYNTGFSVWKTHPSAMILKCVESVCLRKAFSISGMYDPSEIHTEAE